MPLPCSLKDLTGTSLKNYHRPKITQKEITARSGHAKTQYIEDHPHPQ